MNEITRELERIGRRLNIAKHVRDLALRYHKIAGHRLPGEQKKLLTQGRKTTLFAAACLYMACRIERSPHLLIDFADAINEDMFKISDLYNTIKSQILIKHEHSIPLVDPSLFIEKFCLKLDFGEKF